MKGAQMTAEAVICAQGRLFLYCFVLRKKKGVLARFEQFLLLLEILPIR
jgi:hypothetical protein